MPDVPVYMVVNLKVTDSEEYRKYEKGIFSAIETLWGSVCYF